MRKDMRSKHIDWAIRLAACLVIALGYLVPAAAAQSFGGNVKEVYFPFNIYNTI